MRLPKLFAEELGLTEGSAVDLVIRDGRLILTAAGREYALEELVDGITGENRHEESDWGRPQGCEGW